MNVRDLMQREVVTLDVKDTLDLADDIMRLGRIRHLPVMADGAVVGVVSQRDLFRAGVSCLLQLGHRAEQEWLSRISLAAVMTPGVVTVAPDTSIRKAAELMLERKIGCLPVTDGGKLVGLLSETDCLRYLAHMLDIAPAKGAFSAFGPPS
jgi:CBS domain-containing membrane protein